MPLNLLGWLPSAAASSSTGGGSYVRFKIMVSSDATEHDDDATEHDDADDWEKSVYNVI